MWGVTTVASLTRDQPKNTPTHYTLLRLSELFTDNRSTAQKTVVNSLAEKRIKSMLDQALVLKVLVAPLAKWPKRAVMDPSEEHLVFLEAPNVLRVVVDKNTRDRFLPGLKEAHETLSRGAKNAAPRRRKNEET